MGENAFDLKGRGNDAFSPMSDSANATVEKFLRAIEEHENSAANGQPDEATRQLPEATTDETADQTREVNELPDQKPVVNEVPDQNPEVNEVPDQKPEVNELPSQRLEINEFPDLNHVVNESPDQSKDQEPANEFSSIARQKSGDSFDAGKDPSFRPLSSYDLEAWVESQKAAQGHPVKQVSLSLDEVESKVTEWGFGRIGVISPSLSFKTSATDKDIAAVADGIVKASVEQKSEESALQEQIRSANDLGSFTSTAGSVATSLGVGWAISKLTSNLPGVLRIPAVISAAFTSGGIVNNELSGKDMFDKSGFIQNSIESLVAYGVIKSLGSMPANQLVSAETLAKAGMDPSAKMLASQFGNELKMHHHNLEVAAWKAMDRNTLMQGVYYKQLLSSLINPLGALTAKAEMTYLEKGPQLTWEADKLIRSRFNVLNYTPFRNTDQGLKYVGMGNTRTAQELISSMGKNGIPAYDGMTIGEYNTRLMASRIYGASAGAFGIGAAHKTADIVTSEKPNNKTLTENLKEIGKEGLGAAYYAPLLAITLQHGHGAAFSTAIAGAGKGLNSVEHHYQEKKYQELKEIGQKRKESRDRIKQWKEQDETVNAK